MRFHFDLALALGFPHPRYLLPLLTSGDMTDWMVYAAGNPAAFPARSDEHFGVLCALMHNLNATGRRKRPQDYFVNFDTRHAKTGGGQSNAELVAKMQAHNAEIEKSQRQEHSFEKR